LLGKNSQDRRAWTGGLLEGESPNRTARNELPGQDCQERAAGRGLPGQVSQEGGPTWRLGQDRKLVSTFDIIQEINIPPESCLYLKLTFLLIQFTIFPIAATTVL
jgi:hypothetical protein